MRLCLIDVLVSVGQVGFGDAVHFTLKADLVGMIAVELILELVVNDRLNVVCG